MPLSSNPFTERLLHLSRQDPQVLALPESSDPRVLAATLNLLQEEAVKKIVLFADPDATLALAEQLGINLIPLEKRLLWSTRDFPSLAAATQKHIKAEFERRGKAMSEAELGLLAKQPLDQAAYLLSTDQVAAVVAGCQHTTSDVIKAALRGVGLEEGTKTISGSFAMVRAAEPALAYMYGDCAVVIDPSMEQLVDIAYATALSFQALFPGQEARVAFLSFSTKGSARHPLVDKVAQAAALFQERFPSISADGELQFDAAVDKLVALRKAPLSTVAARANCFIFPNLDAGNIAYKITQRLGGFDAYGPILQGTRKPFSDLSRGASAADITISSLIALMRAKRHYSSKISCPP